MTGSARLDLYRFRWRFAPGHLLRLHPLSVAELSLDSADGLRDLLKLGGFPEPFFGGSEVEARRWSREHRSLLVREEVTSFEQVTDLGRLELLMLSLPDRVDSPLSLESLRGDLGVAHKTVTNWIEILERLYAIFRLAPFGAPRLRAVRKQQKHYHLDWSVIPEDPARFENVVACHLLKWVHHQQDTRGRDLDLRFYRDVDGREVDFVVVESRKPILLVECKLGDAEVDRGLRYVKARFPRCEAWQISASGRKDFVSGDGIRVAPALTLQRFV